LLSKKISYWIRLVDGKDLSHTSFSSALEGWDQVSSYVPPQWCTSGCGSSTCGGRISELPSSMSLAPSTVRTIFHCHVHPSWKLSHFFCSQVHWLFLFQKDVTLCRLWFKNLC
jgi:hypothetical protein